MSVDSFYVNWGLAARLIREIQSYDWPPRSDYETKTDHVLHGPSDHKDSWSSDSCQAYVLSLCKVCRGAEASMPTHCPGYRMTSDIQDLVQDGVLDYKDNRWLMSADKPFRRRSDGAPWDITAAVQSPCYLVTDKRNSSIMEAILALLTRWVEAAEAQAKALTDIVTNGIVVIHQGSTSTETAGDDEPDAEEEAARRAEAEAEAEQERLEAEAAAAQARKDKAAKDKAGKGKTEETSGKKYTIDDVRKAVRGHAAKHSEPEAIAILKKHGYGKISEVKEKDFAKVIADCEIEDDAGSESLD